MASFSHRLGIELSNKLETISIIMNWCPPEKFLHTQLSGAPQKYFQLGPTLAKAGPDGEAIKGKQ